MKSPWRLRNYWRLQDYVFAAFMTIGMVASGFIIGPLVPPPLELIAWVPIGSIFLTLGMARLHKRGSVALMISPLAIVLGTIAPVIMLSLLLTTLVTEAIVFLRGNYRAKGNRLLATVVFFVSGVVIGVTSAGLIVGDPFAQLLTQPWLIGAMAVAGGIAGGIGWRLGESIVRQLQRAGKLDADL